MLRNEASLLRTDPSCVGRTNSVGIGVFVMLRNEASVCDRFLRSGICAEDRSLLRRDDKERWEGQKSGGIGVFVMLRNEASVCDCFCVVAFAQKTDPSFVGRTKQLQISEQVIHLYPKCIQCNYPWFKE